MNNLSIKILTIKIILMILTSEVTTVWRYRNKTIIIIIIIIVDLPLLS